MIAIRVDEQKYGIGDYLPESRVWEDGFATDTYLPGTSTLITGEYEYLVKMDKKGRRFP